MLTLSRHGAAKCSFSTHYAKIRAHPCLATRFGGVSGGKETHAAAVVRGTPYGAWILEPSATDLCEPDLHVFAKLFEDRLERGLEAQAFSGREIGGDDDVLDFFVGHLVDVDLARQPAA